MTVVSEIKKNQYNCDGEQVIFPYTFFILKKAHIQVVLCDSEGTETVLELTTHYLVSGEGDPEGGNVTTIATYDEGNTLTLVRDVSSTQETDYIEHDMFPASSHERALDKLTMIVQELEEKIDRTIKAPVTDADPAIELPSAIVRAMKMLGFDENGDVDTDMVSGESLKNVDEIRLIPKTSSDGAEGTMFYDSDDDHVYVATEA